MGRFLNADGYVTTGSVAPAANMFAYCGNNPVTYRDPTGYAIWGPPPLAAMVAAACNGLGISPPRRDLASAPDLDERAANPGNYNCYGNGIGKEIRTNPTGYSPGDSTEKTFKAVQKDLGGARNVRRLKGMDAPVRKDEFKVAMKCGAADYHFIRLTENGWYNKSGTAPGVYIDQSFVTADIWYPMWGNGNQIYIENVPYYNYETVYFAVRIGWDEK